MARRGFETVTIELAEDFARYEALLARYDISISPGLVIEELVEIRDSGYDPLVIRRVMEARSAAYQRSRRETPIGQLHRTVDALLNGGLPASSRRELAAKAFAHVATYDAAIAGYLTHADVVTENRWLSPLAATVAFVLVGVGTIVASTRAGDGAGSRPPRSSVERKVIAAFAGALVLLFVGAGFTYRASIQFAGSIEGVSRSEQLREALASLHMALTGAESAQTAYLLTDRQQQRDEYERLAASARAHQQAIAGHVANDAGQAADFAQLDAQVDRRLDLLAEVTLLYDEAGLSSAKESVASEEGAQLMRSLQAVTARMDERGEALLLERESTLSRSRELTLGSLLLTLAIAAGIFLTLFRGISREMAGRAESEQALRELNRRMLALNETLAQRAVEVGDLEVHVADCDAWVDRISHRGCMACGNKNAPAGIRTPALPSAGADHIQARLRERIVVGNYLCFLSPLPLPVRP